MVWEQFRGASGTHLRAAAMADRGQHRKALSQAVPSSTGTNYVKAGQDTLYLKKYNVQGSNMYKHQYMTNVNGSSF